jgi:hypothetical protein
LEDVDILFKIEQTSSTYNTTVGCRLSLVAFGLYRNEAAADLKEN